ncbi:unnamed protein product, partial [Heterotrigona itama]
LWWKMSAALRQSCGPTEIRVFQKMKQTSSNSFNERDLRCKTKQDLNGIYTSKNRSARPSQISRKESRVPLKILTSTLRCRTRFSHFAILFYFIL